jgi:hypothetical protein
MGACISHWLSPFAATALCLHTPRSASMRLMTLAGSRSRGASILVGGGQEKSRRVVQRSIELIEAAENAYSSFMMVFERAQRKHARQ